jgi:phosphoglycerate dehydrogenase-like enzyme
MDYIQSYNIRIHNARGVYSIPMAEFAIASVLNIYKHLNEFKAQQQVHTWQKHRDLQELNGKTVVIAGCGSIGTECAKRFQAFGCRVIGIATSNREQLYFDIIKSMHALDEILPEADILILAIPLNGSTVNIISSERIELMKSTAVIVNIARGAVIEQEKLAEALYRRRIWGAVLDVFEDEPLLENSNLWNCPSTILTPHNSFVGENNQERLNNSILSTLEKRPAMKSKA